MISKLSCSSLPESRCGPQNATFIRPIFRCRIVHIQFFDQEHFKRILNSLKEDLSQDIGRTVHTMQDQATVFADPNDLASRESDLGVELRNNLREVQATTAEMR